MSISDKIRKRVHAAALKARMHNDVVQNKADQVPRPIEADHVGVVKHAKAKQWEDQVNAIIKDKLPKLTFRSNDNISEHIKEGELDELVDEVAEKMQGVLESLVIDTENDHNTKDTARRVAKMFIRETFGGRYEAMPRVTAFPNLGYKSMYTSGPISIRSTCAHHFQNIVGKLYVGIIPEKSVIGLSKFNRIAHWIAHRPQIQEEMTSQIADKLAEFAETENIAVVLKAEHHCMTHRGVREHENDMTTSIMRGKFFSEIEVRQEFYSILHTMKGIKD